MRQKQSEASASKIIKSATCPTSTIKKSSQNEKQYCFIDTIAIIQDVTFNFEEPKIPKLHWWNRFGIWLSKLRRR